MTPRSEIEVVESHGYRACGCGAVMARKRGPWACGGAKCLGQGGSGAKEAASRPRVTGTDPAPRPAPSRPGKAAEGKSWSNAKATVCAGGHCHPSKMEARVCDRLTAEAASRGATLYRQVRFPLFSLAPTDSGLPHYITVDFVMELPSSIVYKTRRYIDAKHPTRVSPEWRRGAAAFQSCYGAKIEEVAS